MVKTIWLSAERMSEYGVMTTERHVDSSEIVKILEMADLRPKEGTEPPLYDAQMAREAFEAEFGVPVHHREVNPDSGASQRRERLSAVVVKQVKPPKPLKVVMRDCCICGNEFIVPYSSHRVLSSRKTCSDGCRAILTARNSAESKPDWSRRVTRP